MKKCLIVGGSGLIGVALYHYLMSQRVSVSTTSRRNVFNHNHAIHFDLNNPDFSIFSGYSHVFICAGVTNIKKCELDPVQTYKTNVESILNIAQHVNQNGSNLCYISSNAVFNGDINFPTEEAPTSPLNEYGRQKAVLEKQLLFLSNATIVRITKVVSMNLPLFKQFYLNLKNNNVILAYEDLILNPISISYLCQSLYVIAKSNKKGIFHLSGELDFSYFELMRQLAIILGKQSHFIEAISSHDIVFKPRYAGLGMDRTRSELGIKPEQVGQTLTNFLTENVRDTL